MRWLACAAVLLAGLWGTGFAAAAPASPPRTTGLDPATFPEPAILRPAVHFWEDVFGTYSNNQSVLHSSEHPARVIRVLNFSDSTSRADRHRREKHAVARAEHALKRIVAAKANPKHLKGHALHVYKVFGGGNSAKFEALEGTLRTQSGQRDRTRKALIVAQRYRPKMQAIFAKYDLPTALTNLPVVESSFNLAAYSKVGAAGIWQFMPGSARIYMTLNATQDDRRDPWTSTDAAARMLRDNYAALGSWPLAITAYNYGRGGIQNALEATGGSTLADLIKHCDNPR
ncbi:MAG: lytic transglycosylase domain-containing protein, partial [Sinobacteraceae bacterium]|nr:lytic transglycosylase domain-containing protein [Nevskiaceae bacterium]